MRCKAARHISGERFQLAVRSSKSIVRMPSITTGVCQRNLWEEIPLSVSEANVVD